MYFTQIWAFYIYCKVYIMCSPHSKFPPCCLKQTRVLMDSHSKCLGFWNLSQYICMLSNMLHKILFQKTNWEFVSDFRNHNNIVAMSRHLSESLFQGQVKTKGNRAIAMKIHLLTWKTSRIWDLSVNQRNWVEVRAVCSNFTLSSF